MTAVLKFILKFFVSVIFFVAFKMYAGLSNTSYIVQHDFLNAGVTGGISLLFLGWALYPFLRHWIFPSQGKVVQEHTLVRIAEDRITEPVVAAPRYKPEPVRRLRPDASKYRPRAGQYSNKAVAPQVARHQALRNRLTDESMEHYEKYVPKNKKSEYMY